MQASDTLAEEYEAFEVTMKKVAFEHEEGDVLFATASGEAELLDRGHKEQKRLQDDLEFSCEGIVTASKRVYELLVLHHAACENVDVTSASNRRATHEAVCAEVKKSEPKNL